jgi:hypothetical protein
LDLVVRDLPVVLECELLIIGLVILFVLLSGSLVAGLILGPLVELRPTSSTTALRIL